MRSVVERPFAVLAHVDSNLEALEAVLHDLDRRGVHHAVCLGPVVGLGPDPEGCVDLVRARCRVSVAGAADDYVRTGDWRCSSAVFSNRVHEWTHLRLRDEAGADEDRRARWRWLRGLPERHDEAGLTLAHGSARDRWDRVLPFSMFPGALEEILAAGEALQCVAGGIAEQGLIVADADGSFAWLAGGPGSSAPLADRTLLLPGWVGRCSQERAAHTLARYATVDEHAVQWHAVPYDRAAFEAKARRMGLEPSAERRVLGTG